MAARLLAVTLLEDDFGKPASLNAVPVHDYLHTDRGVNSRVG
jgi:hypothetical protein